MKRTRENFNKNSFSNSNRIRLVKPNYGNDKKKVDRIEELNNEIKYRKSMSPFDMKKIKEKIIQCRLK
jgi:hypothetical protein